MHTIVVNAITGEVTQIPYTEEEQATWDTSEVVRIAAILPDSKASFITQVKTEAGAITQQVLQGLGSEYEVAEKEATAYKVSGYPETPVPSSVQSEIKSKAAKNITVTATVACDAILTAAEGWRNAQAELRSSRLAVSSAAEVAVDVNELDVLKVKWSDFTDTLKTQLGL